MEFSREKVDRGAWIGSLTGTFARSASSIICHRCRHNRFLFEDWELDRFRQATARGFELHFRRFDVNQRVIAALAGGGISFQPPRRIAQLPDGRFQPGESLGGTRAASDRMRMRGKHYGRKSLGPDSFRKTAPQVGSPSRIGSAPDSSRANHQGRLPSGCSAAANATGHRHPRLGHQPPGA